MADMAGDDAGAYWCGSYGLGGQMMDAMAEGQNDGMDILNAVGHAALQSNQEHDGYEDFMLRFTMPFTKGEEGREGQESDGDVTPRTQTGESDPADDSSTSTNREVQNDRALRAPGAPGAGIIKVAAGPIDTSPWKVEAPNYGPFGGPFDGFRGFLAGADSSAKPGLTRQRATTSSSTESWRSSWEEAEPQMLFS